MKAYKDPDIYSVGLEGGTRSGKTYDIAIWLGQYLNYYTGKKIIIGRDTKSSLNKTVYQTCKEVWLQLGMPSKFFTKYASEIRYNGNSIEWVGINDGHSEAQGLESDALWVNEADLCDKETVDQMEQRCKELLILDYNPRHEVNWCYDREKSPAHAIHYTTIRDNRFAPKNAVRKVESYEPTPENIARGTADEYLWTVYGLGKRASGKSAVFTDVKRYEKEPTDFDWRINGGDFGFSHDSTAIVQLTKSGNRLYAKLLLYELGLLKRQIASQMKRMKIDQKRCVWDSARKEDIFEMIHLNTSAVPARKGPHSVAWGNSKLKEYEIYVADDPLSEILYQELIRLRWKLDSKGNFVINPMGLREIEPREHKLTIGGDVYTIKDHAYDALRYALTFYLPMYDEEKDK